MRRVELVRASIFGNARIAKNDKKSLRDNVLADSIEVKSQEFCRFWLFLGCLRG